ncbi:MAG: glycoside hydrolase [Bacteroidetes bacterium]|nr:glycoside hydrolase [Bacteroidota bacterium]
MFFFQFLLCTQAQSPIAENVNWKADWITAKGQKNEPNNWTAFGKTFEVEKIPAKAMAKIACDSKYWMWINGSLAVFEGQLKRGPNPKDTYYDEVDISPYLKAGVNNISLLVWYFGKEGFSHKSSGKAGLIFDCQTPDFKLISDSSWRAVIRPEFQTADPPLPNWRLPESSIRYDSRLGNFDFIKNPQKIQHWDDAISLGSNPVSPWNKLVKRPIPQWKNHGLKRYENRIAFPFISSGDSIVCQLPYNAHITPYFKVEAQEGQVITIKTDHYKGGGEINVRGEYVTSDGEQAYENLGWMNGEVVYYSIPKGVKVIDLMYRETGYDTEFSGYFKSDDPFFNTLWQKAKRTLYVTMRDTYMDCPDRERSQWWGDVVNESGEAFYALDPKGQLLTKKGILELMAWQKEDNTIYSPVPSGNWEKELPGQMLASVGYFGFWNYYWNTGDIETLKKVYPRVKKYLDVWKLDNNGILIDRITKNTKTAWYWGDWGENVDKQLLINAWYYLALKGYHLMSLALDHQNEANWSQQAMVEFKQAFNRVFWDGQQYKSPMNKDEADDRAQALAVVSGLADPDKYDGLYNIFLTQEFSSPYMEKYVCEALFQMGQEDYALQRLKKRFKFMVESKEHTTLFEGWGAGRDGFGGGSTNHAWSGGGLTILSQYVCGLYPLEPGWKKFTVKPNLVGLSYAETGNITMAGKVAVALKKIHSGMEIKLTVPDQSEAHLLVPVTYKTVYVNGEVISSKKNDDRFNLIQLKGGTYDILYHLN